MLQSSFITLLMYKITAIQNDTKPVLFYLHSSSRFSGNMSVLNFNKSDKSLQKTPNSNLSLGFVWEIHRFKLVFMLEISLIIDSWYQVLIALHTAAAESLVSLFLDKAEFLGNTWHTHTQSKHIRIWATMTFSALVYPHSLLISPVWNSSEKLFVQTDSTARKKLKGIFIHIQCFFLMVYEMVFYH